MELKSLRTQKGLRQWDMRLLTGIHPTKVCLIEKGYVEPTENEKKLLAKALGVKKTAIKWPKIRSMEGPVA